MSLSTCNGRFWQNRDALLYLCHFMDNQALVLFATSSRFIYRTIIDQSDHWERKYRRKFCLGDQREQNWIAWYNWDINAIAKLKSITSNVNQAKQKSLLSSTTTTIDDNANEYTRPIKDLSFIPNFNAAQWFHAYHRRRQVHHNFMAGRFKRRVCQLPVDRYGWASLVDVNPWYALLWHKQESKLWLIQHDVLNKGNEHKKKLVWKELTSSLAASSFNRVFQVDSVYGTHRYVITYVTIRAYDDIDPVFIGSQTVNLAEMEAGYIRNNEASTALDKLYNIFSTITLSKEQKSYKRDAILVWPINGNSSPHVIYYQRKDYSWKGINKPSLVAINDNWMIMQTKYMQDRYQRLDLYDLDRNKWIEGPRMIRYNSSVCIQFSSSDQCQLLTWSIMPESQKNGNTFTADNTQDLQVISNEDQLLNIQWELLDFQKGKYRYKTILSGQIIVPYFSNAIVKAETYTEKMCLIIVWDKKDRASRVEDGTFSASLSLFAFENSSSNNLPQSLFDIRDYKKLLPINSSDQGRILWTRNITNDKITTLYSEKLIVVQNYLTLDVLDAHNGNLLRSIACPIDSKITPFLGSLCAMVEGEHRQNWFIDMHTGRVYRPPAHLTKRETKNNTEDESLGPIETTFQSVPSGDVGINSSEYRVSNAAIGRINVSTNGLYEAFML